MNPPLTEKSKQSKESLENSHNLETSQRERYYATIHKVALQNNEKIPGNFKTTFSH